MKGGHPWLGRLWVLPWGVGIWVYAAWGWLDPEHWRMQAPPQVSASSLLSRAGKGHSSARDRTAVRAPPPWPDERAIRQQLARIRLQALGFKLGPQRMGATEVRVDLQWQGRLADALEMLQVLALQWPQLRLDALDVQWQSGREWRVDWRGWWRHLPVPLNPPVAEVSEHQVRDLALHRVFDAAGFERLQFQRWKGGVASTEVLRALQPDQLQWVARVHGLTPQAWVVWQQHTVALRVGDVVGAHGGVVRAISPDELVITEAGLEHRIKPLSPLRDLALVSP